MRLASFVLLFMLVLGTFAIPAHAGFLSFFGLFSGGANDDGVISYTNSQNLALLSAARNSDPNPAKGGGAINIVEGGALLADAGPLGTREDTPAVQKSDQISVYVVREGDSISQIANMFGVTVDTIIWSNDIKKGGLIKEGQTLVILPVSGINHTVKKGDTLGSIAKKYKADVAEIISHNGLPKGYTLVVGEELMVPDGKVPTQYSSASVSKAVRGSTGPSYEGYYMAPVNGKRSQGLHGYNAVDIAAPHGTSIYAAASGKVIISRTGWNGGYGNYVVISHPNGTQTLYAHNSGNIVYVGQEVVQGQVIGYVGNTGRSTGPHVHFEVRGAKNPF